jgi:G3E family GTPase
MPVYTGMTRIACVSNFEIGSNNHSFGYGDFCQLGYHAHRLQQRAVMSQLLPSSVIPVNIITGALGAGKTTAIARLLADKPPEQSWLVILNEFTDTGIDTLTLAAAARGAYDVRMIPGGCLCCTGEEDFRRQLSGVLALPPTQWPARILIEPSGIGHPGAIVDELRVFERGGALRLMSTIALLDATTHTDWSMLDSMAQSQVDAADVVLLSKADRVDAVARERFATWAQGLFPAKRLIGYSEQGALPALALAPPAAEFSFAMPVRPSLHQLARAPQQYSELHIHEHAPQVVMRQVQLSVASVQAKVQQLLGREACGWMIPNSVLFDVEQLQALLSDETAWRGVERFKAILRTDVNNWYLLQRWSGQSAMSECNWRQDSRIEVQMAESVAVDWTAWDQRWQVMVEPCPVG